MGVAAKFLASHVLPSILDAWDAFGVPTSLISIHYYIAVIKISNFLVVLNSASNFGTTHSSKQSCDENAETSGSFEVIYFSGRQILRFNWNPFKRSATF